MQDGAAHYNFFHSSSICDISEMKDSGLSSGLLDDCSTKSEEISEQVPASAGRLKLESWLNKNMKIEMTDGRTLVGIFLCTDKGRNVILGSCSEYLKMDEDCLEEDPRYLGLAMVPGHHIISIHIDDTTSLSSDIL